MANYKLSVSDQPLHTREFFQQMLYRSRDAATTVSGKFDLKGYLLREHLHLVTVGASATIDLCLIFCTPFAESPRLWIPIPGNQGSVVLGPNIECRVISVDAKQVELELYISGIWGFDSNLDFLWLAIGREVGTSRRLAAFDEGIQTGEAAKARWRRLASGFGGQNER